MKTNWDRCPLCGGSRIVKKTSDIVIQTKSGVVQVPGIEYHECNDCGERFFDYNASKAMDDYCLEKAPLRKR